MSELIQWSRNDGWILMAVYLAQTQEKNSLAAIIGAADATNHAIPTSNQLSHACTKLVNFGVIEVENSNYSISKEYFLDIELAYKSSGGLFKAADKGKQWLISAGLVQKKFQVIKISDQEVQTAYNNYISKSY